MKRKVGNPNLHGNKNSGRKRAYEEWNKVNAINKLWEKVNAKVMSGEKLTEYEEKLVLSLLPKTIKQDVEMNGNLNICKVLDDLEK